MSKSKPKRDLYKEIRQGILEFKARKQGKIVLADFLKAVNNGLKVLHWDIETSISKFYGFYTGKQYIDHSQIVQGSETKIMSIQYKFEGDTKVSSLVWDFDKKTLKADDSKMLETFVTKILSQADISVGQNLDSFDFKVLNDRLMLLGLTPIDHSLSIDILKLSRKSFRKLSHKLDFRSKILDLGGKHRMERQDWIDIVEGKVSVKDKMLPYGLKDVEDTQNILYKEFDYYKVLPVKVQRVIKEFLIPEESLLRPKCLKCEAIKHRKFDVEVFTQSKKHGIVYECTRCKSTWEVKP